MELTLHVSSSPILPESVLHQFADLATKEGKSPSDKLAALIHGAVAGSATRTKRRTTRSKRTKATA